MNDADNPSPKAESLQLDNQEIAPKVVSAQELFGAEREIHIEHDGEVYRLRITRRGKLILQK